MRFCGTSNIPALVIPIPISLRSLGRTGILSL